MSTAVAVDPAEAIDVAVQELFDALRELVDRGKRPNLIDDLSKLVTRARRKVNRAKKAAEEPLPCGPTAPAPSPAAASAPAEPGPARVLPASAPAARPITVPISPARNSATAPSDPQPIQPVPRSAPMSYPPQPSQPPVPHAYYPPPPPPAPRNGFGVTALVVGIVGCGLGLIPLFGLFAAILGFLGLIFGLLGWSRARSRTATNKGMSIAGTILGAGAIALGIWGMTIVGKAVEDLDRKINDLDREISSFTFPPPSP